VAPRWFGNEAPALVGPAVFQFLHFPYIWPCRGWDGGEFSKNSEVRVLFEEFRQLRKTEGCTAFECVSDEFCFVSTDFCSYVHSGGRGLQKAYS
jgi:hypothetical protein